MRTRVARNLHIASLLLCWLALAPIARAHDDWEDRDFTIETSIATVAGTALLPNAPGRIPCVVLAGGTLSNDRDGRLFAAGAPPRNALRRLAEALAAGGYASARFDRVGYGKSKAKDGWAGTYADEAAALSAVVERIRREDRFSGVIVVGESAGGYMACLAARAGAPADAYVFLGAHCGPGIQIYEYNFARLVEHVRQNPEDDWAKGLRMELALGRHYRAMFDAAAAGADTFDLVDGDFRRAIPLARRKEEIDSPPDQLFQHIKAPTLALAGEFDLNVDPAHAARIVDILRKAGNAKAAAVTIKSADHSFQRSADTPELRLRERYTFESFRRPYQPDAYREMIDWLRRTVPTPLDSHPDQFARIASAASPSTQPTTRPASPRRAVAGIEVDPMTATTPRRVQLAPGVEIVDDLTDAGATAAVKTLEGRIGPLLLADGAQAHFIDMPGGMFVADHPHKTESIIYTVRGQWVLCSGGRRRLMKPGSLFRFAANTPTGYEVPFKDDAFILIFKGDRTTREEGEFIEYLKGMAARLEKEHAEGTAYLMIDLPADHPAWEFARKVNPDVERQLGKPRAVSAPR